MQGWEISETLHAYYKLLMNADITGAKEMMCQSRSPQILSRIHASPRRDFTVKSSERPATHRLAQPACSGTVAYEVLDLHTSLCFCDNGGSHHSSLGNRRIRILHQTVKLSPEDQTAAHRRHAAIVHTCSSKLSVHLISLAAAPNIRRHHLHTATANGGEIPRIT